MINQVKLWSYCTAPRYKYGYKISQDFMHAKRLDDHNGNKQWQEATSFELAQLQEYDTFKDYGHRGDAPNGYK
jgi:hypothetical protein